jgi:predicted nucleic acid-binding protein
VARAETVSVMVKARAAKESGYSIVSPPLSIDQAIAGAAALLRARYRWKLPDAFQAALARSHRLKLVTRNARDFPPERHRFVLVPYRIRVTP